MIKFDQSDFAGFEGSSALVTVERSMGEQGAVSVGFRTESGTGTAGVDFAVVTGTLTWGPGDESTKVIEIPLIADGVADGGETFRVVLSNPTGGATIDGQRGVAVGRILESGDGDNLGDDDTTRPGVLKFDDAGYQVIEGNVFARVAVERSSGVKGRVTVRWTAANGSAISPADFTAASGTLAWNAGDGAKKFFQVRIRPDAVREGNETIRLALSAPTGGATLDPNRSNAMLDVLDNDGSTAACVPGVNTLCLAANRFQVSVTWRTMQGASDQGVVEPLTSEAGLFSFFGDQQYDLLVTIHDACASANAFQVLAGATTKLDYTLTVLDTRTGLTKQFTNPAGRLALPVDDMATFKTCGS